MFHLALCVLLQGFHVSTPLCRSSFFMWEVVTNLEGQLYSENAIFVSHDTVVTSIAVVRTQDNENTVAFFGTQDGFLEKVNFFASFSLFRNPHDEVVFLSFGICSFYQC